MLVTVHVTQTNDSYLATTPDLPECQLAGADLGTTLARIHLEIEAHLGEVLATTGALPQARSLSELKASGKFAAGSLYEIYVEDFQLAAMAVHQAGK
jgi:hypothetical protein